METVLNIIASNNPIAIIALIACGAMYVVFKRQNINTGKKAQDSVKEIELLEDSIDEMKADINTLQTDKQLMQKDIDNLKGDTSVLKEDIKQIKETLQSIQIQMEKIGAFYDFLMNKEMKDKA